MCMSIREKYFSNNIYTSVEKFKYCDKLLRPKNYKDVIMSKEHIYLNNCIDIKYFLLLLTFIFCVVSCHHIKICPIPHYNFYWVSFTIRRR